MPNLVDNWTVDRSPGQGKTLLVSGSRVGIGGLVGIGQPSGGGSSTPPTGFPILPAAGTVLPPPGSSARAAFFALFKDATGFDGKTALYGWPAGTDATSIAISAWINYGVNNIVGYTPNPLQGVLYGANFISGVSPVYVDIGPGGNNSGAIIGASTFWSSNIAQAPIVTWPTGIVGSHWVHYMFSFQSGYNHDRYLIYLNDTLYMDLYASQSSGGYKLSFGTSVSGPTVEQYIGGDGGSESGSMTDGFYGGVAELWVAQGRFVDWNAKANRYLFHTSDQLSPTPSFAPVSLGNAGQAPFGYRPTLYLTGGPPNFIYNRANSLAQLSTLAAGVGAGLKSVDDVPT